MSSVNQPIIQVQHRKERNATVKPVPTIELPGKISNTIGTGEHAKNSLVYLTIKYSFIIGGVLSTFVIVNYWLFREHEKVPDFIADVKSVWDIAVPLITLALGYAFGKSETKR